MNKKVIGGLLMGMMLLTGCQTPLENNDINDLAIKLSTDEFQSDGLQSYKKNAAGLEDAAAVGVDKERFDSQRLYGSETLAPTVTLNYADYGLDGTDSLDDTLAFIAMLEAAKTHSPQLVKLVLPSGDLDFIEQVNTIDTSTSIVIRNMKNIIISGADTNFYFHGETRGVVIENSENIYFENINIDWGIPPTSTAKVISSDGKTFVVEALPGFTFNEQTRVSAFLEFSHTAFVPRTRGNDIYGDVETTRYLGNNQLEIVFKSRHGAAPINTLVAVRHYLYEFDCFFINNSKNIYFESIQMYSAPGMGVRAYSTENLYFNRFSTKLKPNMARIMTVTADALHFIDCLGDLIVTNSLFEYTGDDALNEHGMYLNITEIIDANTLRAVNPRGYNFAPKVGDHIEVHTTMDLTLVQQLTVKAVTNANPGFIIEFNETLSDDVKINDVIGNASRTPQLLFENNIVRNKRCRGVLIQTRGATIRNNTFANLSDAGILVTADANDWYESITSHDILIENNKFLKNNYGVGNTAGDIAITAFGKGYNTASVGAIKRVTIHNNFFGNGANAGIAANSVDGLTISNNLIHNTALLPKTSQMENGIYFGYSTNVALLNNIVNLNASSTFKPLRVGPSVNPDTITVTNNVGFDQSDVSSKVVQALFRLDKLTPSTTLSLMGSDLQDWQSLAQNMQILGISDVELNEREFDDSTFKLNGLWVTYDDEGLYIAYDIYDNDVRYATTSSFWEGDGVEIFMSQEAESQDPLNVVRLSNDSTLQLFMSGNETYGNKAVALRTSAAALALADTIIMNFTEKSNGQGYIGKAFIPFTVIPGIKQSIDSQLPFAFAINFMDVDNDDIRVQYATVPNPVEFNKAVPYKMSKLTTGEIES